MTTGVTQLVMEPAAWNKVYYERFKNGSILVQYK